MMMTVFQTLGEALGSVFGGLALIAVAIMILGVAFLVFAIVLIVFMVKRHKEKKGNLSGKKVKNEQKKKIH